MFESRRARHTYGQFKKVLPHAVAGTVAILVEVRVLAAELIFTGAALYACYIAFQVLIHRLL